MIFNWEFYATYHKDLVFDGIQNEELAINHFKIYGIKEKRVYIDIPIFFNWNIYLTLNPDLTDIISSEYDAWGHFLYNGKKENRNITHKFILNKYCIT